MMYKVGDKVRVHDDVIKKNAPSLPGRYKNYKGCYDKDGNIYGIVVEVYAHTLMCRLKPGTLFQHLWFDEVELVEGGEDDEGE